MVEHLVALVENELADVSKLEMLVAHKRIETAWRRNNDVWVSLLVSQNFDILIDLSSAIEDTGLDIGQILAKSLVLSTNLIGQFAGVAHDQD